MALKKLKDTVLSSLGANHGDLYDHANLSRDVVAQSIGNAPVTVVSIVSGLLTPTTSTFIQCDPETGTADNLDFISLSAVPGSDTWLVLCVAAGDVITVRHKAANGAGSGEIILKDGEEQFDAVVLDTPQKMLVVQKAGTQYWEIWRVGFGVGAVNPFPLTAPADCARQPVFGARFAGSEIPANVSTYTVTIDDSGFKKNVRGACTITFPNPNVADGQGRTWRADEQIAFFQGASSMLFRTHTGGAPLHVLNHDRGLGQNSLCFAWVQDNDNGTKSWVLGGMTQAAPTTPPPPPDDPPGPAGRIWADSAIGVDYTTPDNNIAWNSALSWQHASPAAGKWLYFATYGLNANSSVQNNPASVRVVNTASPSTALASSGRAPFVSHKNCQTLLWATTYGSGAASQTFRIEAANGASGVYHATVSQPKILGLMLNGTGEDYALQSGSVAVSSTTYADIASFSNGSLAAGDYVVIAGCRWNSTGTDLAKARLLIDGVAVGETFLGETEPVDGYFSIVHRFTHAAGAGTVKLQGARNDTAGTFNAFEGIVAVLNLATFEQVNSSVQLAEAGRTSSTYAQRISTGIALKAGWKTLFLVSAQGQVANAVSGSGCQIQWKRNGASFTPEGNIASRTTGGYSAHSYLCLRNNIPNNATDTFTVEWASDDGTTTANIKSATLIALALGPQ